MNLNGTIDSLKDEKNRLTVAIETLERLIGGQVTEGKRRGRPPGSKNRLVAAMVQTTGRTIKGRLPKTPGIVYRSGPKKGQLAFGGYGTRSAMMSAIHSGEYRTR